MQTSFPLHFQQYLYTKTTLLLCDHMTMLHDIKALYVIGGRPLEDWWELDWPRDGTQTRREICLLHILLNIGECTGVCGRHAGVWRSCRTTGSLPV